MPLTADYKIEFNKDLEPAINEAGENLLIELARHTSNAVASRSPRKFGHNAASIAWIAPGEGALQGRGSVMDPKAPPRATDASNVARKDAAAVVSTSGYGGLLNTGTRYMLPRPYFLEGLADMLRSIGKHVEAMKREIEAKAAKASWRKR